MTTTVYTDDGEPTEQSRLLRRALCASPHDHLTWMAYFDALEEAGQAGVVAGLRQQYHLGEPRPLVVPDGQPVLVLDAADGTRRPVPCPLWARHVTVWRGFIHSLTCRLEHWLANGPALVALHPVVEVGLIDREPARVQGTGRSEQCIWAAEEPHVRELLMYTLPLPLFALLRIGRPLGWAPNGSFFQRIYNNGRLAKEDLSLACLQLARARAFELVDATGKVLCVDPANTVGSDE